MNKTAPKVIQNGSKIMSLELTMLKVRFIDSLSFIATPLYKFAETFNLKGNYRKGFFPFKLVNRLSKEEVYTTVLYDLPTREDYDSEGLMDEKLTEFNQF